MNGHNEININSFSYNKNLLKEIEQKDPNKNWYVTCYTNKFSLLRKNWEEESKQKGNDKNKVVLRNTLTSDLLYYGQVFQNKKLEEFDKTTPYITNLNAPMSCELYSKYLVIVCSQELIFFDIKTNTIYARFSNKYFNDNHYVSAIDENTLAVVSSGMDMILGLDMRDYSVKTIWDAKDFFKQPEVQKELRKDLENVTDYRKYMIPTKAQLTHVNTADPLGNNQIGATLFHQGLAIKIDVTTGEYQTVLSGLKKPHGFKPFGKNFVVTNTCGDQIIILDENFKMKHTITGFFDNSKSTHAKWLHTTFVYEQYLIVINQTDCKLVVIDLKNKTYQSINHSKEMKISAVKSY